MQDYIETHLDEKISLSGLAKTSMYSPWYSYRIFREYTGLTPKNYIRRLRSAKAALRLENSNGRMIDVVFDLGFGSADGFTRAFYREGYGYEITGGETILVLPPVGCFLQQYALCCRLSIDLTTPFLRHFRVERHRVTWIYVL